MVSVKGLLIVCGVACCCAGCSSKEVEVQSTPEEQVLHKNWNDLHKDVIEQNQKQLQP